MATPLVSVIIPNYCHAKYLDQRIQSVLSQTYTHFEVIILDDCSPDGGASQTVIERYQNNQHISHIIYNEKNGGSTFRQWRKGFELAKGELIWIAESDDYCDSDLLELLVIQFENFPNVGICFCQSQLVDYSGHYLQIPCDSSGTIKYYEGPTFIKQKMACGNAIWNASSCVFRKSVAMNVSLDYLNYSAAGDRLFWIEIAEQSNVVVVNSKKNYFRQHDSNLSPLKIIDGTTSHEDYAIVRYLENKNHIKGINKLVVREHYLNNILKTKYCSAEKKKELVRLWSYHGLVSIQTMRIVIAIFKKMKEILNTI